jgi:hypothetical protein
MCQGESEQVWERKSFDRYEAVQNLWGAFGDMMEKPTQELSLDRPATYQIKVPVELDENWSDWLAGMTMAVERTCDGLPVTTLAGTFDQAALQGLLRRSYSLSLPLIPVN